MYGGTGAFDWYPDGRVDGGDTFVELETLGGLRLSELRGYTVRITDSLTTLDYVIPRRLSSYLLGNDRFVVWGKDVGRAIPLAGTVSLLSPAGATISTYTYTALSASVSWQYNGSTWVSSTLPTPGRASTWWNSNSTPTPWPTNTAIP